MSFVPIVADWIPEGGKIGAVVLDDRKWFNIGSRDGYLEVHRTIAEDGWRPAYLKGQSWPTSVATDAEIDSDCHALGLLRDRRRLPIGAGSDPPQHDSSGRAHKSLHEATCGTVSSAPTKRLKAR